jgi:hypothetical protein
MADGALIAEDYKKIRDSHLARLTYADDPDLN